MEVWKQFRDTDYEVSSFGKIRSLNYLGHGRTQELKQQKDQKGYLRCRVYVDGKRITLKMHRAVAQTFIPNPLEKQEVNHIDGDKTNNRVDNLEWVTPKENVKHAYDSGLKELTREKCRQMGKKYGQTTARLLVADKMTPVVAVRLSDGTEKEYESQAAAASATKTFQGNINKVLKGIRKSANGYAFFYKRG